MITLDKQETELCLTAMQIAITDRVILNNLESDSNIRDAEELNAAASQRFAELAEEFPITYSTLLRKLGRSS